MRNPYATRRAIYTLDPNRHLSCSIPFEDYLVNLTRRASKGIPVPEESIELFCSLLKRDTRPSWISPKEAPALDASWIQLGKQLVVYDYPASPLPFIGDEEDAWRRKIFTYPPGRYAILRPGPALERLSTSPPNLLHEWARMFQDNCYPLEGIIARGFRDGREIPKNRDMPDLDDLWSLEREAFQSAHDGNVSKFGAILAAGLDLTGKSSNGKTLDERLLEIRDLPPAIATMIRAISSRQSKGQPTDFDGRK